MIKRQPEKSILYKAGALAVTVHAGLLVALLLSVNWQTTHTVSIAEVELWDSIPAVSKPLPLPEPVITPKPQPKPEPKIEKPVAPQPEPKAEIVIKKEEKPKPVEKKPVEKKPIEKEKPLEKPKPIEKKVDPLEAIKKASRDEALNKPQQDALEKIKQDALNDGKQNSQKSSASAGEIDKYKAQIQQKIQQKVIKSLCGDGNPELTFEIALSPDGMLQGNPKLVKSSNISACDDAVDRAILQSQPLPLPADASLRSQFRNLTLKFRPNSE